MDWAVLIGATCFPGESCDLAVLFYALMMMVAVAVVFLLVAIPAVLFRKSRGQPVPWRGLLVMLLVILWPIGLLYLVWRTVQPTSPSGRSGRTQA